MTVKRFGVSLEEELLNNLDDIVKNKRFPNRSQAIRHLINNYKAEQNIDDHEKVSGAIVLLYDHRISRLHGEIANLQHEYSCMALSSQHIHLDDKNCIETIAVKGTAKNVIKLANKLLAIKGIRNGNMSIYTIEQ